MDAALALPVSVAARPRAFVRVSGPGSGDYLQRMVSNDVLALAAGDSCDALLLTPKARVIATLRVLRRDDDDFLLLTEPELGETVRDHLQRMRFAARCEIALEARRSHLVLGASEPPDGVLSVPNEDYGVPGWEILDAGEPPDATPLGDEELERLRIEAGTPRFGREIDDRILPAEAGLDSRAISFDKGCYPGPGAGGAAPLPGPREPLAPGLPDRSRRAAALRRRDRARREGGRSPHERRCRSRQGRRPRLRADRGAGFGLRIDLGVAGYNDSSAPVAQGIERSPAEAEARGSNPLGRTCRHVDACRSRPAKPGSATGCHRWLQDAALAS